VLQAKARLPFAPFDLAIALIPNLAIPTAILYAACDKTFRLGFGEVVCCSPRTGTSWNV
jgi:hypothetical protein